MLNLTSLYEKMAGKIVGHWLLMNLILLKGGKNGKQK